MSTGTVEDFRLRLAVTLGFPEAGAELGPVIINAEKI